MKNCSSRNAKRGLINVRLAVLVTKNCLKSLSADTNYFVRLELEQKARQLIPHETNFTLSRFVFLKLENNQAIHSESLIVSLVSLTLNQCRKESMSRTNKNSRLIVLIKVKRLPLNSQISAQFSRQSYAKFNTIIKS